jgi:hypothetical protein
MEARAYDIVIQSEKPGDSASMFRLMIGDKTIANNMTAVQVHILVGDILERLVHPKAGPARLVRARSASDA